MNEQSISAKTALHFGGASFRLIHVDGSVWVRGSDIGKALGYADPKRGVYKVFSRNAAEFTPAMTMLVSIDEAGGVQVEPPQGPGVDASSEGPDEELDPRSGPPGQAQTVRLFSARGAHLLAIFSRTPRAAEFRQWVLDVLEGVCNEQSRQPLTLGEELRCIRLSVWLMEKVEAARGLERAEELYLRLMRVNRRLGMPTMAFSALALNWRQGELPLDPPAASTRSGH